jgi:hypothetical protein
MARAGLTWAERRRIAARIVDAARPCPCCGRMASQKQLARDFGVSEATISRILAGVTRYPIGEERDATRR